MNTRGATLNSETNCLIPIDRLRFRARQALLNRLIGFHAPGIAEGANFVQSILQGQVQG